jgi:hypothetical protein
MIPTQQRRQSEMSVPQAPALPVLPTTKRRRPVRTLLPVMTIQQPAFPRSRTRQAASLQRYQHAGVIMLCLSAVGLVGALVTFSIMRDLSALERPVEPVITAPLRP